MSLLQRVFGALYWRYFGSHFDVITRRTWDMEQQLHGHVHGINGQLVEIASRLDAIEHHTKELERSSRTAVAGQWDETAIARRIAALEDRLAQAEHP